MHSEIKQTRSLIKQDFLGKNCPFHATCPVQRPSGLPYLCKVYVVPTLDFSSMRTLCNVRDVAKFQSGQL